MLTRNRIRRTLDCLEAREVPATLVELGNLPLVPGHHATLPTAYAAFTLTNNTDHALHFTVQWSIGSTAKAYTLQPGQSRELYVKEVERFMALTATVRVAGMTNAQAQSFEVRSAVVPYNPKGPQSTGPVYTFVAGDGTSVNLVPAAGQK
jgi:hypothetical protein